MVDIVWQTTLHGYGRKVAYRGSDTAGYAVSVSVSISVSPYPGNIDEIFFPLLHKCKDAAKLQACRPICLFNVSLEFSLS
jgi:hypothetical protein